MNYSEVLEFMYNSLPMYQRQGKAAYKANLNNTLAFDEYLNYPHKKFKSIHIAGTNGKGSVAHIISSVLQETHYKIGLYTSPHLYDYRERIKVDGKKVSKEYVKDFINKNINFIKKIKPSFFEMTVALAFKYFEDENVDIAVIEVGMGGRLDSTNIINPLVSVITNIGLDHTAFLGDSIDKIALEKAGIIKANTPVVIGEYNSITKDIFLKTAQKQESNIYFADEMVKVSNKVDKNIELHDLEDSASILFNPGLKGDYQQKNYCTAFSTIKLIQKAGIDIKKEQIVNGFENIVKNNELKGRWEICGTNPDIICDTAHNKEGLRHVISQFKNASYKKLHIIIGFVNDKNIEDCLSLLPTEAVYYFTKANIPRSLSEMELKGKAKKHKLVGSDYASIDLAYKTAIANADDKDGVLITGSTFIVGEYLELGLNQK